MELKLVLRPLNGIVSITGCFKYQKYNLCTQEYFIYNPLITERIIETINTDDDRKVEIIIQSLYGSFDIFQCMNKDIKEAIERVKKSMPFENPFTV